ncbi:MAG TPA: hypothetical protein VF294_13205, partial [Polyangiaceae bacterium]
MKRKDKSRKRDTSATKDAARPRVARTAPRDAARRTAARGEKDKTPTNKKRKARRTGRDREPAASRVEARRTHDPHPAAPTPTPSPEAEALISERSAVEEVGLGDTDIDSEEAFELGIGSRMVPPTTQYGEAFDSSPPAPQERRPGDVEAQIRALEARLDGLIRQRDFSDAAGEAEAEVEAEAEIAAPSSERRVGSLAKSSSAPPARIDAAQPPAEDFISRKWGRSALRSRSEDFDDFGLDPG